MAGADRSRSRRRRTRGGEHARPRQRVKKSYGVLLVDFEPETGRPVALLDRRRYTYAYADIVHDHISGRAGDRAIAGALGRTTVDEKLVLRSLDFRRIFGHIWGGAYYDSPLFAAKQRAFVGRFVAPDAGRRFTEFIDAAPSAPTQWELPKGRPEAGESPLDCAIRETLEETGVPKSAYRIFPEFRLDESITHGDTCYHITYYLGVMRGHLRPAVSCRRRAQIAEVAEVRWMGLEELRALDSAPGARRLTPIVRPALRYAKRLHRLRGRVAAPPA